MRKSLLALLVATQTLTACGSMRDSAFNPFNWFGRSRAEAVPEGTANPLIPQRTGAFARKPTPPYSGVLVDTIKDLTIERTPGGAIIRAKGIARSQGSYEVRLVKEEGDSPNTLTYALKALRPAGQRVGPETGREVVAAKFVTDNDLAGIRTIRVKGARNARVSSRRF